MKKRWSVWLSIFVLIINLIPHIWQGYTVLADSFETAVTNYTNIMPQYTTNSDGTYPTNSWMPTGNQTVINHQGKIDGSVNWDGNTGWSGDPDDVKNSYIEYGGEGSDAEFAIRKYAKETNRKL